VSKVAGNFGIKDESIVAESAELLEVIIALMRLSDFGA